MREAMNRVMEAYGLMVTLSPADEADVRERLQEHLRDMQGDAHSLAIEGLRFLRDPRPYRKRGRRLKPIP